MARKSDGDLQLPTPWLEVTAPWKDDHQKSVLAWLPIPSLRHWKPDLVPEENHAPNPWWHFKSRGHRSACPVLWWPSSIAWMTHHRISSTALWRPARMWLSFFPWYTQSLHWNPNRPSSDASINRSPMWSLRNPCLAGDVRLLKAGHLHIQGMGWQESCDFSANTPEQWSGTDFMRQPPRPTQILFWIEWSSPAIMSENITLCPFVFLSFSPDGPCCRHLARPQSCSPTAGTNLSCFLLKNEGDPCHPPKTDHSAIAAFEILPILQSPSDKLPLPRLSQLVMSSWDESDPHMPVGLVCSFMLLIACWLPWS